MKFETIIYEKEGPLAWITLNRPEKLNAISKPMTAELLLATDKAQCDDEVRVIVVKGAGRAFPLALTSNSTGIRSCQKKRNSRR